jgi:hypothetical protein
MTKGHIILLSSQENITRIDSLEMINNTKSIKFGSISENWNTTKICPFGEHRSEWEMERARRVGEQSSGVYLGGSQMTI